MDKVSIIDYRMQYSHTDMYGPISFMFTLGAEYTVTIFGNKATIHHFKNELATIDYDNKLYFTLGYETIDNIVGVKNISRLVKYLSLYVNCGPRITVECPTSLFSLMKDVDLYIVQPPGMRIDTTKWIKIYAESASTIRIITSCGIIFTINPQSVFIIYELYYKFINLRTNIGIVEADEILNLLNNGLTTMTHGQLCTFLDNEKTIFTTLVRLMARFYHSNKY